MRPHAETTHPTRRDVLRRGAAVVVLPALAALPAGCRCEAEKDAPARSGAPDEPGAEERAMFAPMPEAEPIVRVRVARARGARPSVTIGAEGAWVLLQPITESEAGAGGGRLSVLKGPVEVRLERGGWLVRDAAGFRAPIDAGATFQAMSADRGAGSAVLLGETPYPGFLRFVPRPRSKPTGFDVVNHVALERYLPGVLAKELYPHWHAETFAAQCIAARSFACAEHAHFRSMRHFDMTNTTASQVYAGTTTNDRPREAARVTHGMVLSWADALVPGYYSSCCGGRAAPAPDAIGPHAYNRIPPLRGREGEDVCTEAPLHTWTIERRLSDVTLRLGRFAKASGPEALASIRTLASVTVAEVGRHGRTRSLLVTPDAGASITMPVSTFRRAVDHSPSGMDAPPKRLWSSDFRVEIDGQAATFHGRGYGHGVGLCQYGAEALAQEGRSAREILEWYYPDVEIARAYG
jgi:stage II sporulation protein D